MRTGSEWSDFIDPSRSSADANTMYLTGYLKTNAKVYTPFFKMIAFGGYIEGVYVVPNPFSRDYLYYLKLDIEVTLYDIFGINLIMTVNDLVSLWECYVELFLIDVGIELVGGSKWIGIDSIGDIGSLLSEPKKFRRFKIRFGRLAQKLIKKINEKLKSIAQALKEVWGTIVKDVAEIRDKVTDMTAFLCRSPPCVLSNMLGTMAGNWFSYLQTGLSFILAHIFDKKPCKIQFIPKFLLVNIVIFSTNIDQTSMLQVNRQDV